MDLVLINLPPELAAAITSAAHDTGVGIQQATSLREANLSTIGLAVLNESELDQWERLDEADRPPAYVVALPPLSAKGLKRLRDCRVLGHGPTSERATVADVIARFQRLVRKEEPAAFEIGQHYTNAGSSSEDALLVGWSLGATTDARLEIQAACRGTSKLTDNDPFKSLKPVTWLELYCYLTHGTVLQKGETLEAAWERAEQAGYSEKKPKAFTSDFEKYFLSAAPSVKPTLVLGETGTGKTLVAKELHRALQVAAGGRDLPFHHVNCSTLGSMAAYELFGAMRGAYSDRSTTNPGEIISSYGGTIFLDEFGMLDPSVQAKLLLFLDEATVTPADWVGAPIRVPIQVVAGTNEHLAHRVASGTFRGDLLYRLGRTIRLPPLREVKAYSLPCLIDYILQKDSVNPRPTSDDRLVRSVSRPALDKLTAHDYPGNFRELESTLSEAIERANQAGAPTITSADVTFGASTLPRQDAVVAFILRDRKEGPGREVLLLWNAHWSCYFLPSGRIEKGETFEAGLKRELKLKLGLEPDRLSPVPGVPEASAIQFSVRDGKLKHHFFRPFVVDAKGLREDMPGTLWFPADPKDWPMCMSEAGVSATLGHLRSAFDRLASGSG